VLLQGAIQGNNMAKTIKIGKEFPVLAQAIAKMAEFVAGKAR
jgi:hypothetical protein